MFEAAKIDGASNFRIFCHITFPLLLPISSTVIFIRIIESFKVIDIVRIVTGGGPGNTTETVTLFAYDIFHDIQFVIPALFSSFLIRLVIRRLFLAVFLFAFHLN